MQALNRRGAAAFYDARWKTWDMMIRYSPAPRIRREKIISWIQEIGAASLLDVGCGNGEFLRELRTALPVIELYGADISGEIIDRNRRSIEGVEFFQLDLDAEALPRVFDIVVCMEMVEHSPHYRQALAHLIAMTGKYLFITAPCGPIFSIDRRCGHQVHFNPHEMGAILTELGLEIVKKQAWGFPFFNLYKYLINIFPNATSAAFLETKKYAWYQRVCSYITYLAFKLCLPRWGYQLFIVGKH